MSAATTERWLLHVLAANIVVLSPDTWRYCISYCAGRHGRRTTGTRSQASSTHEHAPISPRRRPADVLRPSPRDQGAAGRAGGSGAGDHRNRPPPSRARLRAAASALGGLFFVGYSLMAAKFLRYTLPMFATPDLLPRSASSQGSDGCSEKGGCLPVDARHGGCRRARDRDRGGRHRAAFGRSVLLAVPERHRRPPDRASRGRSRRRPTTSAYAKPSPPSRRQPKAGGHRHRRAGVAAHYLEVSGRPDLPRSLVVGRGHSVWAQRGLGDRAEGARRRSRTSASSSTCGGTRRLARVPCWRRARGAGVPDAEGDDRGAQPRRQRRRSRADRRRQRRHLRRPRSRHPDQRQPVRERSSDLRRDPSRAQPPIARRRRSSALVDGTPTLPPSRVPTLVEDDGRFRRSWKPFIVACLRGKVSLAEVELELTAQVERLRSAGVSLTHLDAHKHVHAYPPVFAIVARSGRTLWHPGRARAVRTMVAVDRDAGIAPNHTASGAAQHRDAAMGAPRLSNRPQRTICARRISLAAFTPAF